MAEPIIRVEGLGKRYTIRHESERVRHDTLRDALVAGARGAAGRLAGRGSARPPAEDFWALRDVTFDVAAGEVVGIIGRNGAGKSTLLKVLSRITEPTTGRVVLNGRVGSLLEVGTGFHPELTGRENIYLNGTILGMTRREIVRKFDEIVAFSEVEKFLDTPVKRYSSGMYVRLAFAVAAHLEPEILIVDEVLAVGDTSFQQKCLGKMQDVSRSGRTVLFVSHNMETVQTLCGQCFLMRGGRVAASGPTDAVLRDYLGDATESAAGVFDLTDHPARAATGPPVLRRLTLRGPDGSTSRFATHEPVCVDLDYDLPEATSEPRFALAVEDGRGRRLFTVASYFGRPLGPAPRAGRVTCSIPRLRLGTGRYLISASVATRYAGMLDSLDNAGWFEVEARNVYGNGERYLPAYGPVYEDAEWTVDAS